MQTANMVPANADPYNMPMDLGESRVKTMPGSVLSLMDQKMVFHFQKYSLALFNLLI